MALPGLRPPQLDAALVALCERAETPQPPEPGLRYFSPEDYRAIARRLARQVTGNVHVFAYGSLLWRPAFAPARSMLAEAIGWRREFCMEITRWRGSPSQPGLMMALRRGGRCRGLVLELRSDTHEEDLVRLLKREVDTEEDLLSMEWIEVATAQGKVPALAFWAEPSSSRMFVERSLEEQAVMLARACGATGSGAGYLLNTIGSLRSHGISDSYLDTLGERVAEVIHNDFGAAAGLPT